MIISALAHPSLHQGHTATPSQTITHTLALFSVPSKHNHIAAWFFSFFTSFSPSRNSGLGKTIAAARASAAHSYQCVCNIFVCLNNGVAARVGDFY